MIFLQRHPAPRPHDETFSNTWLSYLGREGGTWEEAVSIYWEEAKDAAKHPTMQRRASHSKELSSPNADSAEVKKPVLGELIHPTEVG